MLASWCRLSCLFVSLVFFVSISEHLLADELNEDKVHISGFGTVGVVKGGSSNLGYRRDLSVDGVFDGDTTFKTDSLIGLQLNAEINKDFDAAIQIVAKERSVNGVEESLEWAYLRHIMTPQMVIRAGRIGMDLYMLSEYRNLGYSFLWARPPIEFYGIIAFNYFDGLDFNYSASVKKGTLNAKLFLGASESNYAFSGKSTKVNLQDLIGLTVSWENDRWHARLSAATMNGDDSLNKAYDYDQLEQVLALASDFGWKEASLLSRELNSEGDRYYYSSAGLAFNSDSWLVQSEISYIESEFDVVRPYLNEYLSIGYRIDRVTFYSLFSNGSVRGSKNVAPSPPAFLGPDFVFLQEGVQSLYDLNIADQQSISLGVRWNLRHDLTLKAEIGRTWVEANGGLLWAKDDLAKNSQVINTYTLNLNFVF